ncbi:MAG: tetratricopeptide repeat protein [Acidobacteria bacterium]|nr:tetratricopeptide repeat protein [Acidobacteriota bacterium]
MALAVYSNALPGPFVYDDIVEIRDNPRVHSVAGIPSLFTSDFWGGGEGHNPLYRPLTATMTTLVYAAGGGRAMPFHAVNIVLHALASALAFLLLKRLTSSDGAALAGALLFAIHPVHTEAVAWISGDGEILAALLVMAAWIAHAGRRTSLAAAALALALLSKEGAAVFPALALAGDVLADRGAPPRWRSYGAYAAVVVAYLGLRLAVLGHVLGAGTIGSPLLNPLRTASTLERVLTSASVAGKAIGQSVLPRRLCLDYGFNQLPVSRTLLDGAVLFGLAVVAALVAAAFVTARGSGKLRGVALGAIVFLITFLPTSNLLFPGISIFAERNLYLPVLGICLMAATLVVALGSPSGPLPRGARLTAGGAAAIAALVLVGGGRTYARNAEFRDPLTLYSAAIEACPQSARAWSFHGIALREAGKAKEAASSQTRALAISAGYGDAHAELGLDLSMTGDPAGAERELNEALRINPEDREARANLSSLFAQTGRVDDALREARSLAMKYPADDEILSNLGAALIDKGDPGSLEEARGIFEKLEAGSPSSPLGPNGLGGLYARTGRLDLAAGKFEEALRRSPGDLNVTYNLAQAFAQGGQPARALEILDRAVAAGAVDVGIMQLRDALRKAPR